MTHFGIKGIFVLIIACKFFLVTLLTAEFLKFPLNIKWDSKTKLAVEWVLELCSLHFTCIFITTVRLLCYMRSALYIWRLIVSLNRVGVTIASPVLPALLNIWSREFAVIMLFICCITIIWFSRKETLEHWFRNFVLMILYNYWTSMTELSYDLTIEFFCRNEVFTSDKSIARYLARLRDNHAFYGTDDLSATEVSRST